MLQRCLVSFLTSQKPNIILEVHCIKFSVSNHVLKLVFLNGGMKMEWMKMRNYRYFTYIRLASGFSMSGSSCSLIKRRKQRFKVKADWHIWAVLMQSHNVNLLRKTGTRLGLVAYWIIRTVAHFCWYIAVISGNCCVVENLAAIVRKVSQTNVTDRFSLTLTQQAKIAKLSGFLAPAALCAEFL